MLANILIATGILWAFTYIFVLPLTSFLVGRKLQEPAYAHLRSEELNDEQQAELKKLVTKYYILSDVIVLSIAGFIGGLLGYWFIGISFETRGWPGMIAFIVSSFLGVSVRSSFSS